MIEKKIAVIGIGGVGGYLAGMLAKVCPHLTCVARGKRGESIKENGICLHSDYQGELKTHPETVASSVKEMEEQDLIFICVKNYSLEEVCKDLKGKVRKDTILVPVMNGVDVAERVRDYLPEGRIVESLIYIVAYTNPDYSITQEGAFANLRMGVTERGDVEALKAVGEVFAAAGIDYKEAEDIEAAIWKKYLLNCAYNVATARYNNTIGELRGDEKKAKEYEALVREGVQVAIAKGIQIKESYGDTLITQFYEKLADNATSSLQRDVWAKKPSELETFSGYLVRTGEKLGIDVPVTKEMYEELKTICCIES